MLRPEIEAYQARSPNRDGALGDPAAVGGHGEAVCDDEDGYILQASAIQMPVPTGCCVNRWRMVLTIDVTGWCSAKARTGPGMVWVGTNAELMNGRKMSG